MRKIMQREESYQFQTQKLKKIITEKKNIERVISNRVEKVRQKKD